MRGDWRNLQTEAGESLLDLLHREAEEPLEPDEQALLNAQNGKPDVQATRQALHRAVMLLSGPNPPMPRSVAGEVAADIALASKLAVPALPRSVAAEVSEAVHLSSMLQPPMLQPPSPAHSVAREVVADIQASQALPAPRIPQSVAAAVTGDIRAAQQLSQTPAMPHSVAAAVTAEIRLGRTLSPPSMPRSVTAAVKADLRASQALQEAASAPPVPSVAASVIQRIQTDLSPVMQVPPVMEVPQQVIPVADQRPTPTTWQALNVMSGTPIHRSLGGPQNPAPFVLVGALLVGLTVLAVTTAWPNLAAGAVVLRTLLTQVSPLAGVGLALLLITSVIITWRPTPALRTAGAGAFALSAILTIPALYNVAGGANGLSIGQNVTVSGQVQGNVIAIGGNVHLLPGADVRGEVVTLLGDVHREEGAQVRGHVNALLGHAPGDREAIQTRPVSDLSLATAAAFRPVLGWLGAAAWPQIFVALTGGLLLLLFLAGAAPRLARRQRHAPMRTLALGVLILSALTIPAMIFGLTGLLGPALVATAIAALLIATGLSVSVYDAGRAVAHRFHLPVPDAVGALLGLSAFAASLSYAPLAFALALVGGAWGAGTLFLTRNHLRPAD